MFIGRVREERGGGSQEENHQMVFIQSNLRSGT